MYPTLKSLLNPRKTTRRLLLSMQDATPSAFWVEDEGGVSLFGEPVPGPSTRHPVFAGTQRVGWVCGAHLTAQVAALLTELLEKEYEKKKLGVEVLHLYREINLIYQFSEQLSLANGLEAISDLALQEARQLVDFRGGVVLVREEAGLSLRPLAKSGSLPADTLMAAFFEANLSNAPAGIFHHSQAGPREGAANLLWAPLRSQTDLSGGMLLFRDPGEEFTAAELKLMTTLALQAASAITSALQYQRAAERTLEMQREKLEKEELRRLDEVKSRYYTNITHEFRTPLTIILGMANLPEEPNGLPAGERFEMIRNHGGQMLRLVNQLLDLGKLEDQALPFHYQHGDVIPFIRQMAGTFRGYAAEQGLALEFSSSLPELVMDYPPDALQQVLSNLLSNALKFTPGGGKITLAVDTTGSGPQSLLLTVSDTGQGIPEADLPKVFQRYFSTNAQHTSAHPGTGIGLSHVHELVKWMGGEISVKNRLGGGSAFSICLPVLSLPAPEEAGLNGLPEATTESEGPLLLLIEDNADLAQYLQTCLTPHYQLVLAQDGKDGIAKALDLIPDLVVSDVMMPGADGFEVCQTLKTDDRTSHIPIVLLTARADAPSRIQGLKCGADAYLGKPFEREELLVRLENLLALRRQLQARYALQLSEPNPSDPQEEPRPEDAFIQKLKDILNENLADERFGLPELCLQIGMSRSQLFRKMKAILDESPSAFIRNYRLNRARDLLAQTDLQISEIAYEVGYSDPAYFSYSFHEAFGTTPSRTREKNSEIRQ